MRRELTFLKLDGEQFMNLNINQRSDPQGACTIIYKRKRFQDVTHDEALVTALMKQLKAMR
jgi:hypothetical protein